MKATVNMLVVVAVIGAALMAGSGEAATKALTPQALYKTLLTNSIPNSQLPRRFSSSSTGISTASSNARRHHVVGEVEISIDYGNGVISYLIFPSRQDALRDWTDANIANRPGVKSQRAATGFPTPALIVSGSLSGKDALGYTVITGFTSLAFVDGNVSVAISTESSTNTASGDVHATLALGKLALSHLHAIEKQLGGNAAGTS